MATRFGTSGCYGWRDTYPIERPEDDADTTAADDSECELYWTAAERNAQEVP